MLLCAHGKQRHYAGRGDIPAFAKWAFNSIQPGQARRRQTDFSELTASRRIRRRGRAQSRDGHRDAANIPDGGWRNRCRRR
jgi:hypothetical protein